MPAPEITLTVTLQDITGEDVANASLTITLCGYGQTLPRIAGTSMIAKTGPMKFLLATGSTTGIMLWGNDQITPEGTYYAIEVVDDKQNIIQSGAYQFTGTQTIDLSNAAQVNPAPAPPNFRAVIRVTPDVAIPGAAGTVLTLPSVASDLYPFQLFWGGVLQPETQYTQLNATQYTLNFETYEGNTIEAIYLPN
jgi:hypothetical protein